METVPLIVVRISKRSMGDNTYLMVIFNVTINSIIIIANHIRDNHVMVLSGI